MGTGETETHKGQAGDRFTGDVLVCEDNVINREIIREHLDSAGLTVTLAENGREGLEEVQRRLNSGTPFDLIFMDIQMPVMDGMAAAKEIKALGDETPVIAFTANDRGLDRAEYAAAGFSGFLGKPLGLKELRSYLDRYCRPASLAAKGGFDPDESAGPALDRPMGLEQAGGNLSLYESLLKGFVSGNRSAARELMVAVRAGDLELARRKAHNLRGAAARIGAVRLSAAAAAVETALAVEVPGQLDKEFRALLTEQSAVLREAPGGGPVPEEIVPRRPAGGRLDKSRARELAGRLRPFLAVGDPLGMKLAGEIRAVFGPLGPDSDLLISQMENYDFDLAVTTLDRILRRAEDA